MKRRGHMRLAPLHDLRQLVPVIDFLKLHIFYRCPGDDHTIKFLTADLIERHIEFIQMTGRGILGNVRGKHQKGAVHLQGCIGKRSEEHTSELQSH